MRQITQGLGNTQSVIALNNDGSLTTGTIQDCTPIVERAKALHNIGYTGTADMKLAASIPFVIVEKYCNDNHVSFQDFMNSADHKKRLLNDPANGSFRVWKGQV